MKEKIGVFWIVFMVIFLADVSSGAWLTWTGDAGDGILSTSANWDDEGQTYDQPIYDDVLQIYTSADVLVGVDEQITVRRLDVGSGSSVETSLVLETGSSLTLTGHSGIGMIIGRGGSAGSVTVSNDSFLSITGNLNVANQADAVGILNVYGTVLVDGNVSAPWGNDPTASAQFNLHSGLMQVDGWINQLVGNSRIDIEQGILQVGSHHSLILDHIENDRITAYGGIPEGELIVDYVEIEGTEFIQVTAIPEPATIALLGLGFVFSIRQRKRR